MLVDRQVVTHVCERDLIPAFQEWGEVAADIAQAWQQQVEPPPQAGRASIDIGAFLDRLPKRVADHVSKMLGEEGSEERAATQEQLMWDCMEKIQQVQHKSKRVGFSEKFGRRSCAEMTPECASGSKPCAH